MGDRMLRARRWWCGPLAALSVVLGTAGTGYACVPQPFITIRPLASAVAGAQVTVDGQLFDSGTRIEIRWNAADGAVLGTAQSADFSVPVTVPQGPPGLYTVLAVSRSPSGVQGSVARAALQVTEPGATLGAPTAAGAPSSPKVERDSGIPFTSVAAAVGLVAIGGLGGAWLAGRRKRGVGPRGGMGTAESGPREAS